MKISEVSKKVGLTVPTIRYYCDLSMVPSLRRDVDGERIFDGEAVLWLEGIKFQRELGSSLSEIQTYIQLSQQTGPAALRKRHEMLLNQYEKAQKDVDESSERLQRLENKIELEEKIIKGQKADSLSAARRFST
ncbi:MerR family transcriptional regulator [Companilactobacillus zhachilii]|uniref:MerR family transcriptional regulator n=1 Tax=Companilactobacillus zhachilii TaxID=2304606 RepID=UPI00192395C7|nr:MerR family transcriptional regulator [Companilactobacillus zhachilii]MBL3531621.1 MerR family transcriptional regulator [Companilactobacillus zhachilii]